MHIEFLYNEKTYSTKPSADMTAEAAAERFYENFAGMNKLKMYLDDGSTIIVGETALKSGILRFVP